MGPRLSGWPGASLKDSAVADRRRRVATAKRCGSLHDTSDTRVVHSTTSGTLVRAKCTPRRGRRVHANFVVTDRWLGCFAGQAVRV